jgi:hypothetical protein
MSLSRRKALSLLYYQGLPSICIGVTLSQLHYGCTQGSLGSPQPFLRKRQTLLQESGNFAEEVHRLRGLAIPKYSNLYQAPNQSELKQFSQLVKALAAADISTALSQASDLHYEVVKFTDLATRQILYELREQKGRPMRGWGSYFINPAYRVQALLEAPHIVFDRFSEDIAAAAFIASSAYGFLLAGAHRHANGPNTADVCHHRDSIFHVVHQTWVSPQIKTWQVHGFDASSKSSFPEATDIVLSNGLGKRSSEIVDLNQRLVKNDFRSYAYEKRPGKSDQDSSMEQQFSGDRFRALGATHNIQGRYCHQIGAAFTHVELSERVRSSLKQRSQVARILAESTRATD